MPDADASATLRQGKAARPEPNDDATVYLPIVVPRTKNPDLLGVLYLGRRDGEKGYSALEVAALEALGRKGGMALYLSAARIATGPSAPVRKFGRRREQLIDRQSHAFSETVAPKFPMNA